MTGVVFIAATFSALLQACWNLLARRSQTPADALAGIAMATATLCAVAFPFLGPPSMQTWPWIGSSALCNVLYLRTLGTAYQHPDFCAVFAIVRSIVPAILFTSGCLILSEPARPGGILGLVIIVLSILLFSVPRDSIRRLETETLLHSVSAGLLLALALFLDVQGIRTGGGGVAGLIRYAVASSLTTAVAIAVLALVANRNPAALLIRNSRQCYAGALFLLASYLCGMWAYVQGPIGLVAPVRESSILYGGLLAVMFLRQRVAGIQWTAMVLATMGIFLVQAG